MTSMYRSRRITTAMPQNSNSQPVNRQTPNALHRTSAAVATRSEADTSLGSLVSAAARVAPDAPSVITPARPVSFAELHARAQGAALALSGGQVVDDSALTMALMMCVPGLAVSGPDGLAATLSSVRVQATMAVAGAREV
ncbi:hypothetical protein [Williamsia sp. CHRR-6]|uniref:hypothetical protein n=1 Tax=Williamsia sp. CHRR-6 TaxID=2835871 RepID=UPI001BD9EF1D|nr:hypothetical protein [Williamsia sp. CHRR-6]MBT0565776.1 hypothetical protein [Williamsia sp. CHRR-6]